MLLNFTNHPHKNWSASQLEAAVIQYGAIVDLPFPAIPPEWSTEQVIKKAREEAREILRQAAEQQEETPFAVHIAGEFTFTFALVALLQHKGIHCINSSSERIVIQEAGNQKRTHFEFVQFRAYPSLPTLNLDCI